MEIMSLVHDISLLAGIVFFFTIVLVVLAKLVDSIEPGYWLRFGKKGFNFWMMVVPTIAGISGAMALGGIIIFNIP